MVPEHLEDFWSCINCTINSLETTQASAGISCKLWEKFQLVAAVNCLNTKTIIGMSSCEYDASARSSLQFGLTCAVAAPRPLAEGKMCMQRHQPKWPCCLSSGQMSLHIYAHSQARAHSL